MSETCPWCGSDDPYALQRKCDHEFHSPPWPDDETERLRASNNLMRAQRNEARRENARLRAALEAFAEHFGPLEDNHMLNDSARRCFALARAALGAESKASLAGLSESDKLGAREGEHE